jgi:hypothetical protein
LVKFKSYICRTSLRQFEHLTAIDEKVGESRKIPDADPGLKQNETDDTSCGLDEEGQSYSDLPAAAAGDVDVEALAAEGAWTESTSTSTSIQIQISGPPGVPVSPAASKSKTVTARKEVEV